MTKKLTPRKALNVAMMDALGWTIRCNRRHTDKGRPGEVIEHLPERIRKQLRKLKAEDTQDRVEWIL
jgi:hypothetical protein